MEKIISPAVSFQETDLSTIPQEFSNIDTVFVGTTPKGNFFVPVTVNSFVEYEEKFGGVSDDDYMGLAVREYINEAGQATIMPVANTETFSSSFVNLTVSGSEGVTTVARLFLTKGSIDAGVDAVTLESGATLGDFTLSLSASATGQFSESNLSLFDDDTNFIGRLKNATSDTHGVYVKRLQDINEVNEYYATDFTKSDTVSASALASEERTGYQSGNTPWVLSQDFGTNNFEKLFRFHTLQQGDEANRKVKIEVSNVRLPSELTNPDATHGRFDITVRGYDDTENIQTVYETFTDLSLDPDSDDYIARQIGDMNISYDTGQGNVVEDGFYNNASNFVRVEVGNTDDIPNNAVPFGFERYDHSTDDFNITGSEPNYYVDYATATGSSLVAGIDFDRLPDYFLDSLHKELPVDFNGGTDKPTEAFKLANNVIDISDSSEREFIFGFFGSSKGFKDSTPKNTGGDITPSNTFGLDFSGANTNGTLSYKRALDVLSDDESYDMKLLVMPAINIEDHTDITGDAIAMVEKRADVFLILDATGLDDNNTTAKLAGETFDSSYAGCYYPWVNMNISGRVRTVPPSVLVPSAFAYNDKVSKPWYATLGINRGRLFSAIKPYKKLRKATRDELILSNVNPITSIQGEGTVILGQETLQKRETALRKINVRRLLIEAKKFVSTVAFRFIGEFANPTTRGKLQNIINNYLEQVKRDNGLETFFVDFGEDLNTGDVRDRNLIRGVIELVPTRSAEGIQITFKINNSGTTFNE